LTVTTQGYENGTIRTVDVASDIDLDDRDIWVGRRVIFTDGGLFATLSGSHNWAHGDCAWFQNLDKDMPANYVQGTVGEAELDGRDGGRVKLYATVNMVLELRWDGVRGVFVVSGGYIPDGQEGDPT
jgi:hypothetical protein